MVRMAPPSSTIPVFNPDPSQFFLYGHDTTGGTLWQAKKTAAAGSLWLSYSGSRITSQGVSIPSRGSPSLPCSVRKMTDRRLFFPRTRWNIRRTSM